VTRAAHQALAMVLASVLALPARALAAQPIRQGEPAKVAGVLFSTAEADALDLRLTRLALDAQELLLRRTEVANLNLKVSLTEDLLAVETESGRRLRALYDDAERRVQEAARRETAWWRSPAVWFVAGLVFGGGAVIAAR